mmetsp:Transcript_25580/g.73908  ORF Transcript_25580/g.73908 Transcript_25580/m.73908 type:complete len:285 (-) Transcript_25580:21-875(-)
MYAGTLIDTALTYSRNCRFTKLPPCLVESPRQWHMSSTAASSVNDSNTSSLAREIELECLVWSPPAFFGFSRETVMSIIGWISGLVSKVHSCCRSNANSDSRECIAQKAVPLPPKPSYKSVPRRVLSTTHTPCFFETSLTSKAQTSAAAFSNATWSNVDLASTPPRSLGTSKPSKPKNAKHWWRVLSRPTIFRKMSSTSSSVGFWCCGRASSRNNARMQFCMRSATARHWSEILESITPNSGCKPAVIASMTKNSQISSLPPPECPSSVKEPPTFKNPSGPINC